MADRANRGRVWSTEPKGQSNDDALDRARIHGRRDGRVCSRRVVRRRGQGMTYRSEHKSVACWLTVEEYERLQSIAMSLHTTPAAILANRVRQVLHQKELEPAE